MTTSETDNDQSRPDDEAAAIATDDVDEEKDDAELWNELDEEEGESLSEEAPEKTGAAEDEQFTDHEEDQPAAEQKPAGDKPAGDTANSDPFANATPEQRAAWDAAQAQIEKLEQSDRSQRGRLGAMQRQVNDLMAKINSAEAGERTPADAAADRASGQDGADGEGGFLDSEDYQAFAEEYPEVAGPIGKIIGGLEKRLAKYDERFSADERAEAEDAIDQQTELLTDAHPDWQEVLAAEEDAFMEWLPTQPRHVREAAERNAKVIVDAEEAADVFSRFKAFRSEKGQGNPADTPATGGDGKPRLTGKRQRQLESATGARGKGPGVATGIPEDGDEQTIWDAFDKLEQREAQRA